MFLGNALKALEILLLTASTNTLYVRKIAIILYGEYHLKANWNTYFEKIFSAYWGSYSFREIWVRCLFHTKLSCFIPANSQSMYVVYSWGCFTYNCLRNFSEKSSFDNSSKSFSRIFPRNSFGKTYSSLQFLRQIFQDFPAKKIIHMNVHIFFGN